MTDGEIAAACERFDYVFADVAAVHCN